MSRPGGGWRPVAGADPPFPGSPAKGRVRRRLLHKDGACNVHFRHTRGEWGSYVVDIFTTLVDARWRHVLVAFALSYVLSWLAFGLVFWLIAWQHGDLRAAPGGDPDAPPPCVEHVRSFAAAFLFSLETQTTIGYGHRCVTERCAAAVLAVALQSIAGCVVNTLVVGAAVAKMGTARRPAHSIRFSGAALVGLRDGRLCLAWRVGDLRPRHAVAGTVRAQLLRHAEGADGRVAVALRDLRLLNAEVLLVTPVTVVHEIDRDSPLYALDRRALAAADFEILVTLVYTGDSTGTSHQARSSYVPRDILWGRRFHEVLEAGAGHYRVNCLRFDATAEAYAPFCSARQLDRKERRLRAPDPAPGPGPVPIPAPSPSGAQVRRRSFGAATAAAVASDNDGREEPPASENECQDAPYPKAVVTLNRISVESQM